MIDQDADLYAVMGVSTRATRDELALAYRALLHRHHPDKGVEADIDRTIAVVRAYAILRDPERRARYDNGRMLRWAALRPEPRQLRIATERPVHLPRPSPMRSAISTGLIALYALILCLGTAFALIVFQHIEAAKPTLPTAQNHATTDVDGDTSSVAF